MAQKRKTKRDPGIDAQILAAHRAGASYKTLERRFGLSAGSIRNALTAAKTTAPSAEPATPAVVAAPPAAPPIDLSSAPLPTREDLLAFLSTQAATLRADLASTTEPGPRAAAHRSLVAVQALVQKLLPPPPIDPSVGAFVTGEAMQDSAARVRARWHQLIDQAALAKAVVNWGRAIKGNAP